MPPREGDYDMDFGEGGPNDPTYLRRLAEELIPAPLPRRQREILRESYNDLIRNRAIDRAIGKLVSILWNYRAVLLQTNRFLETTGEFKILEGRIAFRYHWNVTLVFNSRDFSRPPIRERLMEINGRNYYYLG